MSALDFIPSSLAALSISEKEIVLPMKEALEAVDYLERHGRHILGWEGWVKTPDRRVGTVVRRKVRLASRITLQLKQLAFAGRRYLKKPKFGLQIIQRRKSLCIFASQYVGNPNAEADI